MKKKRMSKLLVMALSVSMLLGLSSCGKNDGVDEADNALAKQNVYREESLQLPELGDEMNISSSTYMNDRLYVVANVYHWKTGEPEEIVLFSVKADGSDLQTIELEMPEPKQREDVETGESSGEGEGGGNAGGAQPMPLPMPRTEEATEAEAVEVETLALEKKIAVETTVDADIAEEEWVDPGYYEYTVYDEYVFSENGRLYAIETYIYENYSDPANYIYENENSLVSWDLDGKLMWKMPLEEGGENAYIDTLIPTAEGGAYVVFGGEKYTALEVSADGQTGASVTLKVENGWMDRSSGSYIGKDNKWLFCYYDENGENQYIVRCDLKTGEVSQPAKIPSNLMYGGWECMAPGTNHDLLCATTQGIYGFNIGDTEAVKIMDYVNSDLVIGGMRDIVMLEDGRILGIYYDRTYTKLSAGIFTAVAPEEIADKKILTLGGVYVSGELREDVINFNKGNTEYRIIVKDYSEYNTGEDYTIANTRLNNDIITGNMPDILYVSYSLSAETYIGKGLAADIGELLEKDEELSTDMLLDNIVEAYSMDGKLYQVVPSFDVRTYFTHQGIVGDVENMTIGKLQELEQKYPESVGFRFRTREDFIYEMMAFAGSDFVNPREGICNFNNEDFIQMLEYAKTLPEEINYEEEFYNFNYDTQYMEGKTLMCNGYISEFRMSYILNGYLEGKVNYSGFPGADGSHSVMQANDAYIISAKCENMDGAWQFLRTYLTEEYQEELNYGLPTNKKVFEEKAKLAMEKPYYEDENGNKVEINESINVNGEEKIIEPLNQEQLDELLAFIKSVNKLSYYNPDIQNIVAEEAAPFFSGQKSAEEAAAIIQNRVQLFVDENS